MSQAESGSCMTAEECAGLPDGVRVTIVWEGGNGPHAYELGRWYGEMWAWLPGSAVMVGSVKQAAQIWWDVAHPLGAEE